MKEFGGIFFIISEIPQLFGGISSKCFPKIHIKKEAV